MAAPLAEYPVEEFDSFLSVDSVYSINQDSVWPSSRIGRGWRISWHIVITKGRRELACAQNLLCNKIFTAYHPEQRFPSIWVLPVLALFLFLWVKIFDACCSLHLTKSSRFGFLLIAICSNSVEVIIYVLFFILLWPHLRVFSKLHPSGP